MKVAAKVVRVSKHTGQMIDVIRKGTDRDNFMSSMEAKEFGLIDKVLERMPEDALRGRPSES